MHACGVDERHLLVLFVRMVLVLRRGEVLRVARHGDVEDLADNAANTGVAGNERQCGALHKKRDG